MKRRVLTKLWRLKHALEGKKGLRRYWLKSLKRLPSVDFRAIYDKFDVPILALDCGQKCAPFNPSGKPFCCDICHAVPAAYDQEWAYLQPRTDLWHAWRGDECSTESAEPEDLRAETAENMVLLACQGPALCQRDFRALSCRQFPFFPYITADYAFIGLAYEWAFESTCWVISHLQNVTPAYRTAFVHTFDELFSLWPEEMEGYALKSEQMRADFAVAKRRIPILHRNGKDYLLSPGSERLRRAPRQAWPRFGPYRQAGPDDSSPDEG